MRAVDIKRTDRQTLCLHVGGPQCQIVSQQLHDQGRVAVTLLAQRVQLGDCVIECTLCQLASSVRSVEDLKVEHREVESETEAYRVRWRQLRCCHITSCLVCNQAALRSGLAIITSSKLSQISVIISLPTFPTSITTDANKVMVMLLH